MVLFLKSAKWTWQQLEIESEARHYRGVAACQYSCQKSNSHLFVPLFFEMRLRKKIMEEAGLKNSALWSFYPTLGSNNINHMLKINKDVNQSRQRNPQPLNKYHKLSIIIVYHVEIFPQRWKLWVLWSTAAPWGQEAVSRLQCRLSTLWGLGTE